MRKPICRITAKTSTAKLEQLADLYFSSVPMVGRAWHQDDIDVLCQLESPAADAERLADMVEAMPEIAEPVAAIIHRLMSDGLAEVHAIRVAILRIETAIRRVGRDEADENDS